MPGAYAEVHLKLPAATAALIVPVTALIFRAEGLQVAVVREGGKAELVHVTQGRDFGTEVEVTSGITANRIRCIVNHSGLVDFGRYGAGRAGVGGAAVERRNRFVGPGVSPID